MAVYKRSYRGYSGPLTRAWSRFAIIPRYTYRNLFQSKFLTAFFVACFFPFLICVAAVYLNHNASLIEMLRPRNGRVFAVDAKFFLGYLNFQAMMAFILTAFVAPSLISSDLANNALPLYFCRPFSRTEYIAGKMSVLIYLLSLITWVPGLVLFLIQANLEGNGWIYGNLWIGRAIFLASWIWILILSLISLALSAWVKWKLAARALLIGIMFVGAGFGEAINLVLLTKQGDLVNLVKLMATVWLDLFRIDHDKLELSTSNAWTALLLICALCLALLARRIRAFEVVR